MQNYLSRSFLQIANNKLTIGFYDVAGTLATTVDVAYQDKPFNCSLDYAKWSNALSKLQGNDITVQLTNSGKGFTLSTASSSDKISLAINNNAKSVDVDNLLQQASTQCLCWIDISNDSFTKSLELIMQIFAIAKLDHNAVKFNAITNDFIYADRSVILHIGADKVNSTGNVSFLLDKITIPLILQLSKFGVDDQGNTVSNKVYCNATCSQYCWSDMTTKLLFSTIPSELAFPTEAEENSLVPQGGISTVQLNSQQLLTALDFFAGFYEGSVWKPLTFQFVKGKGLNLHYKSVTTEINKAVDCDITTDAEFTFSSEIITLLLKACSSWFTESKTVQIVYDSNPSSPSAVFKIGGMCKAICAKLMD